MNQLLEMCRLFPGPVVYLLASVLIIGGGIGYMFGWDIGFSRAVAVWEDHRAVRHDAALNDEEGSR